MVSVRTITLFGLGLLALIGITRFGSGGSSLIPTSILDPPAPFDFEPEFIDPFAQGDFDLIEQAKSLITQQENLVVEERQTRVRSLNQTIAGVETVLSQVQSIINPVLLEGFGVSKRVSDALATGGGAGQSGLSGIAGQIFDRIFQIRAINTARIEKGIEAQRFIPLFEEQLSILQTRRDLLSV